LLITVKTATVHAVVGDILVPAHFANPDEEGTLQSVIDNAPEESVIVVAPAEYKEQLVIDKPLTLLGPNAVFEGYGQRNNEAVITYPDIIENEKLVRILSDDVEIRGLYFQDGGKTSGNLEAILARGDNLIIKNNVFEGFSLTQMRLTPESSSVGFNVEFLIEGNLFKNKPIGNFALYIQGSSGVARLNKFENVKNGLTVQPYHHSVGGVIEDNEIEVWYRGIWFNGAYRRAGEWVFDNNTVNAIEIPNDAEETAWYGLRIETFGDGGSLVTGDLPSARIINNTVNGAGASSGLECIGISFHQPIYSDLLVIKDNVFTNVDFGGNIHNPDGPTYMVVDLYDIFPLNAFPEGSQVIGNKIMVPEEGKIYNQQTGNEYYTIQEAIGEANANETILVGDGNFTEDLTIDKALTLKSLNGSEKTTLNGTIEITANDVTIEGFTVTAPSNFTSLPLIHMINADNVNIINNVVTANYNDTGQPAIGTSKGPAKVTGKIAGNTVAGAIGVGTDGKLEVIDNTVTGAASEGIWFYPGWTRGRNNSNRE